jgi:hypothetical protein
MVNPSHGGGRPVFRPKVQRENVVIAMSVTSLTPINPWSIDFGRNFGQKTNKYPLNRIYVSKTQRFCGFFVVLGEMSVQRRSRLKRCRGEDGGCRRRGLVLHCAP